MIFFTKYSQQVGHDNSSPVSKSLIQATVVELKCDSLIVSYKVTTCICKFCTTWTDAFSSFKFFSQRYFFCFFLTILHRTLTCAYAYTHICVCVYMYMYMRKCMCIHVYAYMVCMRWMHAHFWAVLYFITHFNWLCHCFQGPTTYIASFSALASANPPATHTSILWNCGLFWIFCGFVIFVEFFGSNAVFSNYPWQCPH